MRKPAPRKQGGRVMTAMAATLALGLTAAPIAEGEVVSTHPSQRQDTMQQTRLAGARYAFIRADTDYRTAVRRSRVLDLAASRATSAYRTAATRVGGTSVLAAGSGLQLALARTQFATARGRLDVLPLHGVRLPPLSALFVSAAAHPSGTPATPRDAEIGAARRSAFYRARGTQRDATERDGELGGTLAHERQTATRLDLRSRQLGTESANQHQITAEVEAERQQALRRLQSETSMPTMPDDPYIAGTRPAPTRPVTQRPRPAPSRPVGQQSEPKPEPKPEPAPPPRPAPPKPAPKPAPPPRPAPKPAPPPRPAPRPTPPHRPPAGNAGAPSGASKAIGYAKAQLGKPYKWGGVGPDGFDCSGLVMRSWQAAGHYLPRVAAAQYKASTPIARSALAPGDLVFWANGSSANSIYHEALYLGRNQVIEAPEPGQTVKIVALTWNGTPRFFAKP